MFSITFVAVSIMQNAHYHFGRCAQCALNMHAPGTQANDKERLISTKIESPKLISSTLIFGRIYLFFVQLMFGINTGPNSVFKSYRVLVFSDQVQFN